MTPTTPTRFAHRFFLEEVSPMTSMERRTSQNVVIKGTTTFLVSQPVRLICSWSLLSPRRPAKPFNQSIKRWNRPVKSDFVCRNQNFDSKECFIRNLAATSAESYCAAWISAMTTLGILITQAGSGLSRNHFGCVLSNTLPDAGHDGQGSLHTIPYVSQQVSCALLALLVCRYRRPCAFYGG